MIEDTQQQANDGRRIYDEGLTRLNGQSCSRQRRSISNRVATFRPRILRPSLDAPKEPSRLQMCWGFPSGRLKAEPVTNLRSDGRLFDRNRRLALASCSTRIEATRCRRKNVSSQSTGG